MSEFDKFFGCVQKVLTFHWEKECITYLISKGLSIGIVLFSFTSKLPQIINMYNSEDIKGLSYISIYLDIISFLCSALYPFHMGYSFMTYGESVIILIENLIIFLLAWRNDKNQSSDRQNMTFTLIICGFLFSCYKGVFNDYHWKIVRGASTILGVISRLTQIIKSCKEKSTGPLSTITFGLNMLGNIARIFTTIKETNDLIMTGGFVISFVLNLIIFLQIIHYNRPKEEVTEIKQQKDEAKENSNKTDKKGHKKKKD